MADDATAKSKQQGLQQAASVIFALVAVVPLLIFAWTLHTLGVIRSTQAQLSLGLALTVALLGFWMFRSMLGRMAEVVQALAAAVEQANRTRRPSPATPPPPAAPVAGPGEVTAGPPPPATPQPANGAATPAASKFARSPAPPPATPRPAPASAAREPRGVPGIGNIRELTEVVATMDSLWYREATAHLGHRVQISVANSREPLIGTLAEASTDGLILEQADGPVAIGYRRVTAIDRLS